MKFSLLAFISALVATCYAGYGMAEGTRRSHHRAAVKGLGGRRRGNRPILLAAIDLAENSTVSFYSVRNDTVVMNAAIAKGSSVTEPLNRLLISALGKAKEESDPVTLYQMIAGNDAVPDELVQAWDKVQDQRKSTSALKASPNSSGPPPMTTKPVRDEAAYQHRHLQSTGDWWTDNYCTAYGLVPDTCECYQYLTGDYSSYVLTEELWSHVYVEEGRVGQAVAVLEDGEWFPLSYMAVEAGITNTMGAWGVYGAYGAFVMYAWDDSYHWSMYAVDYSSYDDVIDDYDYGSGGNVCWNTLW